MSNVRYIISDASKKVDVEPHVLRYWEEELGLNIPRNEMGHRYYREEDVDTLRAVKLLKEEGFQLRAIKMLLPDIHKVEKLDPKSILRLREEMNQQLFHMEGGTSKDSGEWTEQENKEHNGTSVVSFEEKAAHLGKGKGTSLPVKGVAEVMPEETGEKMGQFKIIMRDLIIEALKENNHDLSMAVSTSVSDSVLKEMDYMLRVKEEREEERFKKLDEAIRGRQKARKEVAAADSSGTVKKKKGLFKKNK